MTFDPSEDVLQPMFRPVMSRARELHVWPSVSSTTAPDCTLQRLNNPHQRGGLWEARPAPTGLWRVNFHPYFQHNKTCWDMERGPKGTVLS